MRLEKPRPFLGNSEDPATLEAFLYSCELYFSLDGMANPQLCTTLALLWLDRDAAVWWQTVRQQHPTGTLAWEELKLLLKQ